MTLLRPTLAGRAGLNLDGYGPGVGSPFGRSPGYPGDHHGQDYFWLGSASAAKYGISTASSKEVYPVKSGTIQPITQNDLGTGAWQQLDSSHRAYYWHLSSRTSNSAVELSTTQRLGVMGDTGTATTEVHLHFEIRVAPYSAAQRIDPEPFFSAPAVRPGSLISLAQAEQIAGWLNRPYNSKEYWVDLQTQGSWNNVYAGTIDGIPGPLTFAAEKALWEKYLAPKPNERVVNSGGVFTRSDPSTAGAKGVLLGPGQTISAVGWTRGESVSGNNIWFKANDKTWFWSGGFTDAGTSGIAEIVADPPAEPDTKTLNGIDISAWQKGINLAAVPGDFVIIKATEGTTYLSEEMATQYDQAKKSGKLLGLYHFASKLGSAADQADWFLSAAGPHAGEAVFVLDWEADAVSLGAGFALEWLNRVHLKSGVRPLIYMNQSTASRAEMDIIVSAGYSLWMAAYPTNDRTGYITPKDLSSGRWPNEVMRQYSSAGELPGYSSRLDLNIFYGNKDAWLALAAAAVPADPEKPVDPDPETPVDPEVPVDPEPETPVEPGPKPKPAPVNVWMVLGGAIVAIALIIWSLISGSPAP